jgi:pyruvate dehydrogenase E1 component alpha subunit
VARASAETELFKRGISFEIDGFPVDGMDVLAVRDASRKAVAKARTGGGPTILEMKTYRYRGHSMSDPAKYRTREEVDAVREKRDPIDHLKKVILDAGHSDEESLKEIDRRVREVVAQSARFAQESPQPDAADLMTDIYAEA